MLLCTNSHNILLIVFLAYAQTIIIPKLMISDYDVQISQLIDTSVNITLCANPVNHRKTSA